mmetsp:Transcript_32111/g.23717  ORF Transcript_32111/g.23717 Transcript_32111/m.23717 type:complete len:95 (-) Transcript_32111:886-1170(-)
MKDTPSSASSSILFILCFVSYSLSFSKLGLWLRVVNCLKKWSCLNYSFSVVIWCKNNFKGAPGLCATLNFGGPPIALESYNYLRFDVLEKFAGD